MKEQIKATMKATVNPIITRTLKIEYHTSIIHDHDLIMKIHLRKLLQTYYRDERDLEVILRALQDEVIVLKQIKSKELAGFPQ